MGIHVARVGESITQGVGPSSPAASYPSVLASLLGAACEVENDGRSGTTLLASGDFPYRSTVQFTASTAWAKSGGDVVIQLGANDSKPRNWDDEASFVAVATEGCQVSAQGTNVDALATFFFVAFALQRVMKARAA